MSRTEDRTDGDLAEGYAEVGEVRLHYVEAGEGPLLVLLHGFPEFWYGWRLQLQPLAAAGFRVVAPTCVQANHWQSLRHFLGDADPAYTPEELDRYIEAWSQPGAATGMLNYYRASVRTSPKHAHAQLGPISAPTLVIWGQGDRYLGPELAEPDHDDVPNLDRVERLPDASHWVHHDQPERVTQLLTDFFTGLPTNHPAR